mmetsp:Transcript_1536/g.2696  ORF Transcript_1536/g.2696 Transcript_1536/m.2696 type:complete len:375 (-) Transcript_1536:24-1148(-)|eukprot:CAMPEP_0182503210 /NCGR_PEP_ID=MMETSP1321-20130603/14890_1 /TAXON_ID=91990 /ORGANISM="Bolidomonas sp., Strain RCC1657" /LENGTH=374 /DNA_ID=CAMNT_0024708335 /DNA_START=8 /DNA_END=1132 /DNA_ORIENTATION=-
MPFLSDEIKTLWFQNATDVHGYQCDFYPGVKSDKVWSEEEYLPLCHVPYMPKGWADEGGMAVGSFGGLLGDGVLDCSETYATSYGAVHPASCAFFGIMYVIYFSLLFTWFRASRGRRKTKNAPHPPYSVTEKFYVGALVVCIAGVFSAIDIGAAAGRLPNWLYSAILGVQGSGVNVILVLMVTNWIAIMTARGRDTSMLPWVQRTYNVGIVGSIVDFLCTSIEEFTAPEIDGAYNGTVNGVKHAFLGLLEGYFCVLGLVYALKMKSQMSSGQQVNEKQKEQVKKIVGYAYVVGGAGSVGVLFRFSRTMLRLGVVVYPAPSCSVVGFIMGALVELVVLLVVTCVVVAQRPSKQKKVKPHGETMMTTAVSNETSTE